MRKNFIQYMVLGFESKTFRTWVSYQKHLTTSHLNVFFLFFAQAYSKRSITASFPKMSSFKRFEKESRNIPLQRMKGGQMLTLKQ